MAVKTWSRCELGASQRGFSGPPAQNRQKAERTETAPTKCFQRVQPGSYRPIVWRIRTDPCFDRPCLSCRSSRSSPNQAAPLATSNGKTRCGKFSYHLPALLRLFSRNDVIERGERTRLAVDFVKPSFPPFGERNWSDEVCGETPQTTRQRRVLPFSTASFRLSGRGVSPVRSHGQDARATTGAFVSTSRAARKYRRLFPHVSALRQTMDGKLFARQK
jgi:hypothetical protein